MQRKKEMKEIWPTLMKANSGRGMFTFYISIFYTEHITSVIIKTQIKNKKPYVPSWLVHHWFTRHCSGPGHQELRWEDSALENTGLAGTCTTVWHSVKSALPVSDSSLAVGDPADSGFGQLWGDKKQVSMTDVQGIWVQDLLRRLEGLVNQSCFG